MVAVLAAACSHLASVRRSLRSVARYDRPMRIFGNRGQQAAAAIMLALSACATTHARGPNGAKAPTASQPVILTTAALTKVPIRWHAELASQPPTIGVPSAWHLHGPGPLNEAMLARIKQLTHAVVQVESEDMSQDVSAAEVADEGWWLDLQFDSAVLPYVLAMPQITLAIPAHSYWPFDPCQTSPGVTKCKGGYTDSVLREALAVGASPIVRGLAKIEGCMDPGRTETLARLGVLVSSVIAGKQCGYTILGVGMPVRWITDFVALPWVTSFEMSPPKQLDGQAAAHDSE